MKLKVLLPLFWLTGALSTAYPVPGFAATPTDDLAPTPEKIMPERKIIPMENLFGKEMLVRHWVLCSDPLYAEALVIARSNSVEDAQKIYALMASLKQCGRFPEMRVELKGEIPVELPPGPRAYAYEAAVFIAGKWKQGFIVFGSLPPPEQ